MGTNVEERKLSLSCTLTLKLKITELLENFINVHVYMMFVKKPHRKCSLKASTGTCSLKLQIVLCSSNNFIQFTVKKLWRRLVYWVTYLLSGPPGSKLDSCCCSLGRLEWFCPKLKYVCSNPDIKDEHLKHDKSNNKSLNQSNCLFIHPSTVLLYFKVVSHKSYLIEYFFVRMWNIFIWR